jgi:hypothetical protein
VSKDVKVGAPWFENFKAKDFLAVITSCPVALLVWQQHKGRTNSVVFELRGHAQTCEMCKVARVTARMER